MQHLWRRIPGRQWGLALVGLGIVWMAWAADTDNLLQLHRKAREHADECTGCHGELGMVDTSTDPAIRTIGPMKMSNPMLNFTCVTCHPSVDLEQHSSAATRVQVAAELCVRCHGVSRCPKRPHPMKQTAGCVGCHKNWAAKMKASRAAALVHVDKIGPADCWKCHGGIPLFQVPQE